MLTKLLARRTVRRYRLVSITPAPAGLTVTGVGFGDGEPVETLPVLALGLTVAGHSVALVAHSGSLEFGASPLVAAGVLFDSYTVSP